MGISPPRLGEGAERPRPAADLNPPPQCHWCHRFSRIDALGRFTHEGQLYIDIAGAIIPLSGQSRATTQHGEHRTVFTTLVVGLGRGPRHIRAVHADAVVRRGPSLPELE